MGPWWRRQGGHEWESRGWRGCTWNFLVTAIKSHKKKILCCYQADSYHMDELWARLKFCSPSWVLSSGSLNGYTDQGSDKCYNHTFYDQKCWHCWSRFLSTPTVTERIRCVMFKVLVGGFFLPLDRPGYFPVSSLVLSYSAAGCNFIFNGQIWEWYQSSHVTRAKSAATDFLDVLPFLVYISPSWMKRV